MPAAMAPQLRHGAEPVARRTRPVTIDEEGLRLPPQLLDDDGGARSCARSRARPTSGAAIWRRSGRRSRSARGGCRRWRQRYGADELAARADGAHRLHGARSCARAIAAVPDGVYAFADSLDDDGAGRNDVGIRVHAARSTATARVVDFSDSDDEVDGPLNAVYAVTLSAVVYAFRLLLPEETPTNARAATRRSTVIAPEGCVLNARPPRAVAAGNVETSQRVVDVVLGALAQALPGRIPAASAGTMSQPARSATTSYAYYETIGGGAGASAPARRGASGIQTHMTNTRNTPVEALEHALPVRVVRYARPARLGRRRRRTTAATASCASSSCSRRRHRDAGRRAAAAPALRPRRRRPRHRR